MANTVVWADIPVVDMDRARRFYTEVLRQEVQLMPGGGAEVAVFPDGPVSADLAAGPGQKPNAEGGCTVYLNANGDIEGFLSRVEAAGGTVLQPAKDMGPFVGLIGFFLDSEGNRMGVQQPHPDKQE